MGVVLALRYVCLGGDRGCAWNDRGWTIEARFKVNFSGGNESGVIG
jgi:hypothetical protein